MSTDISIDQLLFYMKIEPDKLPEHLESFIKEHMDKLEREGVVLGLSGGIDSAVVAALCKRAIGAKNTLALMMPDKDSKKEHIDDAVSFAKNLGIEDRLIDITPYLKNLGIYKLFMLNRLPLPERLRGNLTKKAYSFYQRRTRETPFLSSLLGFKGKDFNSYLRLGNAYYRIKHRLRMIILYLHAELENRLVVGAANKMNTRSDSLSNMASMMPLILCPF